MITDKHVVDGATEDLRLHWPSGQISKNSRD